MKKTLFVSGSGLLLMFLLLSFKGKHPPKKLSLKTGIYGVCSSGNVNKCSVKVELSINEDKTFHYFDNTNPSRKIDVKGNWTLINNTVVLKDYTSEFSIHNKWSIDDNEKCLKSRKGLNFTRLCHL